jgi:hypothetical protein
MLSLLLWLLGPWTSISMLPYTVSLNRDLVFSYPHEIPRVGGSEIQETGISLMVVPESRMAEFLSGYCSIEKAAPLSICFRTKNAELTFPTLLIKSHSSWFLPPSFFFPHRLLLPPKSNFPSSFFVHYRLSSLVRFPTSGSRVGK